MSTGTILIVDDEQTNLDVLDRILGDDHAIVSARSGEEALRAARLHKPNLILLDLRLPDLDGYQVCARLKSEPSTAGIPVIFVTACDDVAEEAQAFSAGAVDYLVKPVVPVIVQARVRNHLSLTRVTDLERSYREAIHMLGQAGHLNDNDTGVHTWRMAAFSRALAEALGWSSQRCNLLELAATMHDMGKLGIPHSILRKPAKLDPAEWAVMKTHSRIGWEILSKSDSPLFNMAAEIALHHHEKWDGSGYPDGLAGLDIDESSRIVAIADVFDALSMRRPYKEAWPVEKIVSTLLDGAGNHFDPSHLRTFFEILPRILEIKREWDEKESASPASRN